MRMKFYLMWVLVIVIMVTGCGTGNVETQNGLQSTEESNAEIDKWEAYITSIKSEEKVYDQFYVVVFEWADGECLFDHC